ncbi:MAG: lipocalin family protein, partial [Muriicola sp.]|nr:lipocalin family protein [Muriicola sp.]
MLKRSLVLFILGIFAISCGVSKDIRVQRNLLSGSWTLDDVRFENNTGMFKAVVFDDADAICFEGSNWFFRDNNSTGRYTIKEGSLCEGGDRFIRWSVIKNPADYTSQLQFKFIDDKRKDISGGLGYRLNITELTAGEMTLKSNVTVDAKPITIVY